jgi:hypothetical protein
MSNEQLAHEIEEILLYAGADGVEWGTELENTVDALMDLFREWAKDSGS